MELVIEIVLELIGAAIEYGLSNKSGSNKKRITNIYELKQQEHKYFLLVAVLIYVFYEDDLTFSYQKKNKLKKYIKLTSIVTHKKTREDLKRMLNYKVDIENLKTIITDYSLSQDEVNDVFKLINKRMSEKDKEMKYSSLLRRVHTILISEF